MLTAACVGDGGMEVAAVATGEAGAGTLWRSMVMPVGSVTHREELKRWNSFHAIRQATTTPPPTPPVWRICAVSICVELRKFVERSGECRSGVSCDSCESPEFSPGPGEHCVMDLHNVPAPGDWPMTSEAKEKMVFIVSGGNTMCLGGPGE